MERDWTTRWRMTGALLLAVLGGLLAFGGAVVAPTAGAQERAFGAPRYSDNIRGDIAVTGNALLRCQTVAEDGTGDPTDPTPAESADCITSRTQDPPCETTPPTPTANGDCFHNSSGNGMKRIDVDGAGGMFMGSRATLTLPAGASVVQAWLYWSGVSNSNPVPDWPGSPPNPAARNGATIDPPGPDAPVSLVAAQLDSFEDPGGGPGSRHWFNARANVTSIVQAAGAGVYQVGNVQCGEGRNRSCGWALYVIYTAPGETLKNVSLFDGFQNIFGDCPGNGCVDFNLTGFRTPPSGPVRTTISIQGQDGDFTLSPNGLLIDGDEMPPAGPQRTLNPPWNIMNGTISRFGVPTPGRSPSYYNTLMYDLDEFDASGVLINDQTSTAVRFGTDGQEPATLEVLSFVTDLFEPQITQTKAGSDVNGGDLRGTDEIEYVLSATNAANDADGATNFLLVDNIPANTTYVPGSVSIDSPHAGDSATFNAGANRVEYNLGLLSPGESRTVRFRVRVNDGAAVGTVISNTCSSTYNSVTFPTTPLSSGCPTVNLTVTGPPADLAITKSHSGQFVTGLPQSFRIDVENVGGVTAAASTTVTDPMPSGLAATGASGTGWDCSATTAAQVSCTTTDDLGAGDSYPPITVGVNVASTASGTITNTATVANADDANPANNSDSDDVAIVQSYDVSVTKVNSGPATVFPGETATFTIFVSNHGPGSSGPVSVAELVPDGFTPTGLTTNFGTCDLATRSCAIPFLSPPPANTATITLTGTPNAGTDNQTLVNRVTIDPGAADSNSSNNSSQASVNVAGRPDMTILKSHQPAEFVRGTTGTWFLDARNVGTAPTSGTVTVQDTFPAGVTPTIAGGAGWSCGIASQTVTCTRGDALAANQAYPTITVNTAVGLAAASPLTNTATVGGGGEINTSNNSDDDTVALVNRFDVAVTKSVTDAEILPGETTTFFVDIVNNGPSVSGTIAVDEVLPPGLQLVSVQTNAGTCNASADCSIPARNPGEGARITIVMRAPAIVDGSLETNNVSINPGAEDTNAGNHNASATVRVLPVGRYEWEKTSVGDFVRGTNGTYRIVATNTGGAATNGPVTVNDPMPAGLTLVNAAGSGWNCTASTPTNMSCTRSDALAPNASHPPITLTVAISLTAPATLVNTVSGVCTAPTVCPVPNEHRKDTIDVIDLSIDKTVSPTPTVRALSNATWTLTIRNAGPSNANGVSVDDTLPAGMTLVSATASGGGTCTGTDCSWPAPIGPNQTRTVTIVTTATLAARDTDQTNTATVTATNIAADTQRNNETDTATVRIVSPDLALDKDMTGRFVRGANVTWDLTVSNVGTAIAVGPQRVVDTLPVGLSFVSATGAGWTCGAVMQVITCTRPDSLDQGLGLPVIEVTARTALDAPSTLTNRACVNGPAGEPDPPANNCDEPAASPVVSEVDLAIDKTATPTSILATQETTYTIDVTNNGPSIAEDVVSTDLIPAGFIPVSAATTAGTCTTPEYTCALGDMQPGASETITIVAEAENAKPPAESTVTNTATVTSSTTELDASNNTDTADVEVRRTNDLLTVKTQVTKPAIAGAPIEFEVLITNLGPSDAVDTHIEDVLPPQLIDPEVVGGPPAMSCGANATETIVACDIPFIAAGTAAKILVRGTLRSDSAFQQVENGACAENPNDPETANNCDTTEKEEIQERADIAVTKTGPATVRADAQIEWKVTIRNNGPSDAPETKLEDTLPENLAFVSITPSCPIAERVITCDAGTLKPGDVKEYTVVADTALSDAERTLTNRVTGAARPPEPENCPVCVENNQAQAVTTVDAASDLAIVKTGPPAVPALEQAVYTLTATNKGPSASPDTVITDSLPADSTLVSAVPSQGSCTLVGRDVVCQVGTIPAGGSVTAQVTIVFAKAVAGTRATNVASVRGANHDPDEPSNRTEYGTEVRPPLPDLRTAKRRVGSSGVPVVGQEVTFEIVVDNIGEGPATNAIVTDRLPDGLRFVSARSSAGTCRGLQVVNCAVGTIPSRGQVRVTLVAEVRSRGSLINVARATADQPDKNELDNEATLATTARETINPVLRKRGNQRGALRGGRVPYTITFRNPGPGTLRNVDICDRLPAGMTYESGTAKPAARLRSGRLCWRIKSLAAGRSATMRFRANVARDAPGRRITNTVTASGAGMRSKTARARLPLGGVLTSRAEGVTG